MKYRSQNRVIELSWVRFQADNNIRHFPKAVEISFLPRPRQIFWDLNMEATNFV